MTLVSMLFSNWWEEMKSPHRLLNQDFGIPLSPEVLVQKSVPLHTHLSHNGQLGVNIIPQLQNIASFKKLIKLNKLLIGLTGCPASTVHSDKDNHRVDLDVQQFAPEEINVKVVDHFVVVEGKHGEKQDPHGSISRQFTRKYLVPEQCDIDQVSAKLSSDGVLSIIVPRKPKSADEDERKINVEQTGKSVVPIGNEGKKLNEQKTE